MGAGCREAVCTFIPELAGPWCPGEATTLLVGIHKKQVSRPVGPGYEVRAARREIARTVENARTGLPGALNYYAEAPVIRSPRPSQVRRGPEAERPQCASGTEVACLGEGEAGWVGLREEQWTEAGAGLACAEGPQ